MNESILEEAQRIVHGPRQVDYGHPRDNHTRTASLWVAYLCGKYGECPALDAEDVCFLNLLQKVARQMNAPKRDNLVDAAGYINTVAMVLDEQERRERFRGEAALHDPNCLWVETQGGRPCDCGESLPPQLGRER